MSKAHCLIYVRTNNHNKFYKGFPNLTVDFNVTEIILITSERQNILPRKVFDWKTCTINFFPTKSFKLQGCTANNIQETYGLRGNVPKRFVASFRFAKHFKYVLRVMKFNLLWKRGTKSVCWAIYLRVEIYLKLKWSWKL